MSTDKLGNNFLRVPWLPADRKGFVVWKESLEFSIRAWGLYGHLDKPTVKLTEPPKPEGAMALTEEQVSSADRWDGTIQWLPKLPQYLYTIRKKSGTMGWFVTHKIHIIQF